MPGKSYQLPGILLYVVLVVFIYRQPRDRKSVVAEAKQCSKGTTTPHTRGFPEAYDVRVEGALPSGSRAFASFTPPFSFTIEVLVVICYLPFLVRSS